MIFCAVFYTNVAWGFKEIFEPCTDGLYYSLFFDGVGLQEVVFAGIYCDSRDNAYSCPVGYYCPSEPYAQPIKCPAGYYCDTDETLPYANGTLYSSNCVEEHMCAYAPIPCPDGTYSIGGAYECTACASVPCEPTTGAPVVTEIACGIGIERIVVSTGLSFALYAEKYTDPSIVIRYNDNLCYGKLESGAGTNSINVKYNNKTYHMID